MQSLVIKPGSARSLLCVAVTGTLGYGWSVKFTPISPMFSSLLRSQAERKMQRTYFSCHCGGIFFPSDLRFCVPGPQR